MSAITHSNWSIIRSINWTNQNPLVNCKHQKSTWERGTSGEEPLGAGGGGGGEESMGRRIAPVNDDEGDRNGDNDYGNGDSDYANYL